MVNTDHRSPGGDADTRVDELRQRLRALGYLDAGVDRFVLGAAHSTRRPLMFTLLSALRVGALAAVLLGPAATLGAGGRMPGLITGPRDAIVVAAYLGAASGVAMTLAAMIAAVAVAAAARVWPAGVTRHATALPRLAGGAVAVACLAYLTLWWQAVIADVGWASPVWTSSALAIAAAISLLLGHAVAVLASAVLVVHARGSAARSASWRTSAAAIAIAFGGAALLLTWSGRLASAGVAPPLTVVPSGARLKIVAIDGFDPRTFTELSSAGRVPALTAAFAGPVVALRAGDERQSDPARTWTTLATGQPASVHGVRGLETRRVPGVLGSLPADAAAGAWEPLRSVTDLLRLTRPSIASGSERRAKTFWEVADEAGLRTAVVNWWATWPAADAGDSGNVVLSDRATLRLELGGTLDGEIAPAALYEDLRQRWSALKAGAEGTAADALSWRTADEATPLLARSAQLDAIQLALVASVASPATDLAAVYLPGLDIAQHALLGSQAAALAPSALNVRLQAVRDYYVVLDRLLAANQSLAALDNDLVMIVTGPGRAGGAGEARLAVRGRHVSTTPSATATSVDVAPTLLYALGLPLARDAAGKPLLDVFAGEFTRAHPPRYVESYGEPRRVARRQTGTPLDQEMIDRLRSLGYVR